VPEKIPDARLKGEPIMSSKNRMWLSSFSSLVSGVLLLMAPTTRGQLQVSGTPGEDDVAVLVPEDKQGGESEM
jgi:hypothetical protein